MLSTEPACSCPDFQYRDELKEYKHIIRTRLTVGQIDVEELESELERTASELPRSAAQLESKAEGIYDQASELENARGPASGGDRSWVERSQIFHLKPVG